VKTPALSYSVTDPAGQRWTEAIEKGLAVIEPGDAIADEFPRHPG
jgi:hypothetical protein